MGGWGRGFPSDPDHGSWIDSGPARTTAWMMMAEGGGVRYARGVVGRVVFIVGVFAVLAFAAVFAWVALDLPPPELVLQHGFPPAGGPTGRDGRRSRA